jgi:ubiquitin-protein ligase
MSAVRLRRLQADFLKLQDYVSRHPRVELVQSEGDPPERYQIKYQILSLRQKDDRLEKVDRHLVEITLPLNYPRTPPLCRMLTPIFHPNIAPHAICIGDHWSAGETLSSIVARIGELIAYQSYNTKSPLNGEAARWTAENLERLPLDQVSMVLDEAGTVAARAAPIAKRAPAPAAPAAPPPEPEPEPFAKFSCPDCGANLKLTPELRGKRVRCPRCRTVVRMPGEDTGA